LQQQEQQQLNPQIAQITQIQKRQRQESILKQNAFAYNLRNLRNLRIPFLPLAVSHLRMNALHNPQAPLF
jgi:hypothetical protein